MRLIETMIEISACCKHYHRKTRGQLDFIHSGEKSKIVRQHLMSGAVYKRIGITREKNEKIVIIPNNNHNNNRVKQHQGQMTNKQASLLKMRADRGYNNRAGRGGVCQKKPTGNRRLTPRRFPDANSAL